MTVQSIFEIIKQYPGWAALAALILGSVTVKKLELPVWRWGMEWLRKAAENIGRCICAAVLDDLKEVKAKQDELDRKLNIHIGEADRNWAEADRQHILDFSTGLANGTTYDYEAFRQAMSSIDKYEAYCKSHPDYPNSLAVGAIEHIRHEYQHFLSH